MNSIEDKYLDSYTLVPFVNAQQLNCGGMHRFSLVSCIDLFGPLRDGAATKNTPCPLCNRRVTKYDPDPLFQEAVEDALAGAGVQRAPAPAPARQPQVPAPQPAAPDRMELFDPSPKGMAIDDAAYARELQEQFDREAAPARFNAWAEKLRTLQFLNGGIYFRNLCHQEQIASSSIDALLNHIIASGMTVENQLATMWDKYELAGGANCQRYFPDDQTLVQIVVKSGVNEARARQMVQDFRRNPLAVRPSGPAPSPSQLLFRAWGDTIQIMSFVDGGRALHSVLMVYGLDSRATALDLLNTLIPGMTTENQIEKMREAFSLGGYPLQACFPSNDSLVQIVMKSGVDEARARQMVNPQAARPAAPAPAPIPSQGWFSWPAGNMRF